MLSIGKWFRPTLEFTSFSLPLEVLGISFDDSLLVKILHAIEDFITKGFFKSITSQTSQGLFHDHLVIVDMKPNSFGNVDLIAIHCGGNTSRSNFEQESELD